MICSLSERQRKVLTVADCFLASADCLCAGIQACLLVKDMCSSIEEHLAVVSTMESVNLLMKRCMTKLTTLQVAGFLL